MAKNVTLDEIFIKHGTDKGSLNGHDYAPFYEKHLPKSIGNFLEIGAWKGAGIKSFKEWYNDKGKFYSLDRFLEGHGLITPQQLQALGINSFTGSQSDFWFLEGIKENFTVIIDDGSHLWPDQINTFRRLFLHNLEPNGVYVIEDVFDEPYWGAGIIKDSKENFKGLCKKFHTIGSMESQFITPMEDSVISPLIKDIFIYDEIIFIIKM